MPTELDLLTAHWQKRPGASIESIREREASLGFMFPVDYVTFMVTSNGAFGDNVRVVIEIDPIEEMAPDDQPLDGVPGVFRFGGDGAEETFAFDIRRGDVVIVAVRDSIDEEDILRLGRSFTEFVRNVSEGGIASTGLGE
jgi:hypothetical protein